ncbi:MAG: UDP-N-acetylmuramate dehydrogenase, partial [Planctomycetota bacterium]
MNWLNEPGWRAERDVPLADLTWFRLGGRARYVVHPGGAAPLGRLLRRALETRTPVKILGGGANVLVRDDGFEGVVVRLDEEAFQRVEIEGPDVRAGAGADLMELTQRCSQAGLAGLECLAGVPGTVGGAIHMNAGGRYGDVSQTVATVDVLTPDGRRRTLSPRQVGFAYRRTALGDRVVTGATFHLRQEDPREVYARYKEIWRCKKASQPLADHSAGCIFANPAGDSAGRLIDRAGLKGARCGGAYVSQRHANFIVADSGATADDVLDLIDLIRQT